MKLVLGLMSGTSLDGIDIAAIRTDGETIEELGPCKTYPYDDCFRERVRASFGRRDVMDDLEKEITNRHIQAVERFLQAEGLSRGDVSLIGFHGQTVFHDPDIGVTVQLGDGAEMARATGIDVINDLRSNDVKNGGQGAPLVPVFHKALTKEIERPHAVLNLGGVGNVTWIDEDNMLAFDTGPGNALVDDWIKKHLGKPFDEDGQIALQGEIHHDCINSFICHPYFNEKAPKSLDRDEFKTFAFDLVQDLTLEDGAATLTAMTIASVLKAEDEFPFWADLWVICGGGRLNKSLMSGLRCYLHGSVIMAEDLGWNGDAIEAQAFAYLAARAEKGLPITFPGTTGVSEPISGGVLHRVK